MKKQMKVELWKTSYENVCSSCSLSCGIWTSARSFLPSILSEELVLELFQVLAESLLLLSGLLELLQKFLPVRESVEKFQNLTGIFESTLMVYYTAVEEK